MKRFQGSRTGSKESSRTSIKDQILKKKIAYVCGSRHFPWSSDYSTVYISVLESFLTFSANQKGGDKSVKEIQEEMGRDAKGDKKSASTAEANKT